MLTKLLALKIFEAFSIQRWNDRIRPFDLCEMDKHAYKMIVAYIIGNIELIQGKSFSWEKIIYGGFFSLLRSIALSDIKHNVRKKLREIPGTNDKMNDWVIQQYELLISDENFLDQFRNSLDEIDNPESDIEYHILRAANYYTTYREFQIIKYANESSTDIVEKINNDVEEKVKKYIDEFLAIDYLYNEKEIYSIMCIIEQLWHQSRWSQTPKIPRTSVLGHSMMVASLMILLTKKISSSETRLYCNFFSALFHDIPEAVTRDIISPIKKSVTGFQEALKKIETKIFEEDFIKAIKDSNFIKKYTNTKIINEFYYFTGIFPTNVEFKVNPKVDESKEDEIRRTGFEFKNRTIKEDNTIDFPASMDGCRDIHKPIDGELIKIADDISALLEAYQSIKYGISSQHLTDGLERIFNDYLKDDNPNGTTLGIDIKRFFMDFKV